MKAFRFRAAKLLEWRQRQADLAGAEFARASQAANETARILARAEQDADDAEQHLLQAMASTIDADQLERHRNWIARQQEAVLASRRMHEDRCRPRDAASDAFRLARRHVRIMERLRDRSWRRYLDETRKSEMKELDQLAAFRYVKRIAEGGSKSDR